MRKAFAGVVFVVLSLIAFNLCAYAQEEKDRKDSRDYLRAAASGFESNIAENLKTMGADLKTVAQKAARTKAGREQEMRKMLLGLCINRPYAIDAAYIDAGGVMRVIEPKQYKKYEGSDISKQEAVVLMQRAKKPGMSKLLDSVEGIKSVDIEYPVFRGDGTFSGSISILIRQDEFIRSVVSSLEKQLSVKCWVMQKDGITLYETDQTQVGLNIFDDPLYRDFPELISLAKRMIDEKNGTGRYTFLIHGTDKVVTKEAAWRTIDFFDREWIVVVYEETER